jgi:hypothetical protein
MKEQTKLWNLNDYLMSFRDSEGRGLPEKDGYRSSYPLAKRVICKDGFSMSVQANHGAYCSPRENIGPWWTVEVGFPSEKPDNIMSYAEDYDNPTDTVYGYVPIELVEELIASHGGVDLDAMVESAKKV